MRRTLTIICLEAAADDYGVYASHRRGPFGTPLVYRGTLDECLAYRSANQ